MKKIALLLGATVFSLLVAEYVTRLMTARYSEISEYKSKYSPSFYSNIFDNVYEKYNKEESEFTIITLGDSYTNGGNVKRKHTYPEQLYHILDESVNVVNMGLCEDTSSGSLFRLESYLKKIKGKFIVVVLIGAADIFDNFSTKSEAMRWYWDNIKESDRIIDRGDKAQSQFLKLSKYVYMSLYEKLLYSVQTKDFELDELIMCHQIKSTHDCREEFLNKNETELLKNETLFVHFLNQEFFFNKKNEEFEVEENFKLLFNLVDRYPKFLKYKSLIFNLMAYSKLQSHFSSEDIFQLVKKRYFENLEYIDQFQHSIDNPDHIENIILV